jgi:predicted DNA binding CopG/RHH family protein
MGDMVKKNIERKSLEEKAAEREARKLETVHLENETIDKMVKKTTGKDRAISARVNGVTYTNFKKICEARGITSNACLNVLISDFVLKHKDILEK